MKVGGPLDLATLEHVSSDPVTELVEGRVIYRTDTKVPKVYQNGAWSELGSGSSGSGEINYVLNPSAELGVSEWNEYSDSPGTSPVDGTGGTAGDLTLTATAVTAEVIRGTQSFKLAKGAANGQGQGYSADIAIDAADKNKLLKFEFEYWTSANYADDDIAVFIYDVDNAVLITPTDSGLPGSSGTDAETSRRHAVQWSSTDSDNYRAIIHISSTNATAYDLYFDNVIVGPGVILTTPAIMEWESFTPVLTASTTAPTYATAVGYKRRLGDSMHIEVHFSSFSNAGSGDYRIEVPDGLTPDSSKFTNLLTKIGGGVAQDGSSRLGVDVFAGTTTLAIIEQENRDELDSATVTWTSSGFLSVRAAIPILEWSGQGTTNALVQDNLSEWTAFTPIFNNDTGHSATVTDFLRRQVGDTMEIKGRYEPTGDGTDVGNFSMGVPGGLTVPSSASGQSLGPCAAFVSGTTGNVNVLATYSTGGGGLIEFSAEGIAGALDGNDLGTSAARITSLYVNVSIPITEFAGSQNSLVGFTGATDTESGLAGPLADTSSTISSGTYAPTISNFVNCSTPSNESAKWTRVGDIVTVNGLVSITSGVTLNGSMGFDIDLPFARNANFSSTFNGIGICSTTRAASGGSLTNDVGIAYATSGAERLTLEIERTNFGTSVTGINFRFTIMYQLT